MFADFPLINLVVTVYFMVLLGTIFAAFGWCDPNEYQKKIGLDIFSGIMAVLFWRYSGMIISIVESHVTPGESILASSMDIFESLYSEIGFERLINSMGENQLLGLIFIGVAMMLMGIAYIVGAVCAIYFPFRMLLILDLYIDNIMRYILMGIALVGILILGISSKEGMLTIIMMLFGIASIAALVIGNLRLYNAHKNPYNRKNAYAYGSKYVPADKKSKKPIGSYIKSSLPSKKKAASSTPKAATPTVNKNNIVNSSSVQTKSVPTKRPAAVQNQPHTPVNLSKQTVQRPNPAVPQQKFTTPPSVQPQHKPVDLNKNSK